MSNPWGKPLLRARGLGRLRKEEDSLPWASPTMLQSSFIHPGCEMVLTKLLGPNMGNSSYRFTGKKELEIWVLDAAVDFGISSHLHYTRAYKSYLLVYISYSLCISRLRCSIYVYIMYIYKIYNVYIIYICCVYVLPTALVLFISTRKVKVKLICRTGTVSLCKLWRLSGALSLWSMDLWGATIKKQQVKKSCFLSIGFKFLR